MPDPLNPLNADNDRIFSGEGLTGAGNSLEWNDDWDIFWRDAFATRPYAPADATYDRYQGAYRYGHEAAMSGRGRSWGELEPELEQGWNAYPHRGPHAGDWQSVHHAVRDAWEHVRQNLRV